MQKRFLAGVIMAVVTFGGWMSSRAVILPPPQKKVTILWDYPQLSPEIVFNVYGTTNLALPMAQWPLITNVSSTSCVLPMLPGNQFFTVTASNTVTRSQSTFATR